jgi:RNA polymerase sigma-70 factor, ECF subfamily
MMTVELALNKSTYIISWLTAFIQNHSTNGYIIENSLAQADSNDIVAILNGDGNAFTGLIKRYQNKIAAKMCWFTRDKQQIEELVQDVFIESYRSLRSFKKGSPFFPWLMKIAVRVGYKHWKKIAGTPKEVSLNDLDEVVTSNKNIEPSYAAEMIHNLLATLSPKDRLVLTLIYLEGCSVVEAAEITGWSRIMVKVRAHRARGKLKLILEKKIL